MLITKIKRITVHKSHDIVKAFSDELKVETKEANGQADNETGAKFIIQLPV